MERGLPWNHVPMNPLFGSEREPPSLHQSGLGTQDEKR